MRIISQDGLVDCNYEDYTIILNEEYREIIACYGKTNEFVMGKYSSLEKCYKVLEQLRFAYCGIPNTFNTDELSETELAEIEYHIKNIPQSLEIKQPR